MTGANELNLFLEEIQAKECTSTLIARADIEFTNYLSSTMNTANYIAIQIMLRQ